MVENIKTQLTILEHEDKTSKGFDYTRFKCQYSDGSVKWMSAFNKTDDEKETIDHLKESEGRLISVDICNPKDDLWNIKKFHGIVGKEFVAEAGQIPEETFAGVKVITPKKQEPDTVEKPKIVTSQTTMFTSYCKDVYIALRSDKDFNSVDNKNLMAKSIEIIKQARDAFS
jgi:hypothetical protein